ncbi:MAG: VanZ family protein [Flavobacteriaceae bacterium]|nr:VanZ family protein [Flavobacteriaceae bacterium]
MSKKILLIFAISYTLVLAILSLINVGSLPRLGSNFDDKIFHALAYGLLVLLWYFTLHSFKKVKPIFIAALCSIIYGIIIEVLQGQLTMVRNFEILDILANCIGVIIASLFLVIRNRTIVKNL